MEMMLQRMEYLHNNPLKRRLVATPEHWRYSSAHEGCTGRGAGVALRSLAVKHSFTGKSVPKFTCKTSF